MFKKALLILAGLFLVTTSVWAGRCPPPPVLYNAQTDSYIVIEGTISGLPASYYLALPKFPRISLLFSGKPSSCDIEFTYIAQDRSRGYYCRYYIFKNTSTNKDCWQYFRNLNNLTLKPDWISVQRSSSAPPERWDASPSSRTVTLGPVHTRSR